MSRAEFDRFAAQWAWRRGDYDARRGLAEVVAEPSIAHEWRVAEAEILARELCRGGICCPGGSMRIEWRDSVLEPDASFYFDEAGADWLYSGRDACRPERGDPPPRLIVEINRTTTPLRAIEKRSDYLDMGVDEIWSWTLQRGASIHGRGDDGHPESLENSRVLPGLTRADLDLLWSDRSWREGESRRAAIVQRLQDLLR